MFDPNVIKNDFPILARQIDGKPLVYLDNAATSQKPEAVISAIANYYRTSNANVHRGVHTLSDESTQEWEKGRNTIAQFFGAQTEELIITRNTTEAINGIAYGWGDAHITQGDIIISTPMEHHSDLVVWQQLCKRTGAKLEYLEVTEQGELDTSLLDSYLNNTAVKLIALAHVSNALGTKNPVEALIQSVKQKRPDILVAIDGAQSAPHMAVDFHALDADFYCFSGHKMLGPMGIGGLLVKHELIKNGVFRPWLFGGGMIATVERQETTFAESSADVFTAGTPDVASIVGLAAACEYLQSLGMTAVAHHDTELVAYALERLKSVPQVKIVGPLESDKRVGSVSFIYENVHAHDVAQVLDSEGVAVRSGHHCTMPLHTQFNWQATVRASFQVYNSTDDIDVLVKALDKVKQIFNK
ncbi:MAG: cysteine desulfurase / selenocysteine lyase [Patescibacteria group bacterium]|nr:cysteine desulfurase / selenocysteine lyase [Patescibacteria group bacterium]